MSTTHHHHQRDAREPFTAWTACGDFEDTPPSLLPAWLRTVLSTEDGTLFVPVGALGLSDLAGTLQAMHGRARTISYLGHTFVDLAWARSECRPGIVDLLVMIERRTRRAISEAQDRAMSAPAAVAGVEQRG